MRREGWAGKRKGTFEATWYSTLVMFEVDFVGKVSYNEIDG